MCQPVMELSYLPSFRILTITMCKYLNNSIRLQHSTVQKGKMMHQWLISNDVIWNFWPILFSPCQRRRFSNLIFLQSSAGIWCQTLRGYICCQQRLVREALQCIIPYKMTGKTRSRWLNKMTGVSWFCKLKTAYNKNISAIMSTNVIMAPHTFSNKIYTFCSSWSAQLPLHQPVQI